MNSTVLLIITVLLSSITIGFSQYFRKRGKSKLSKFLYALSFCILLVFLGFRAAGIGVDDARYANIFGYVKESGPISTFNRIRVEPGYLIINYIVSLFSGNYQVVIFVMAFLSLLFFFLRLKDEKENISLPFAIIIFGFTVYPYFFGIIRLALAMCITFYATRYMQKNDRFKYNFFVLLATSIHISAAVMLLLNFIFKKKITKKLLIRTYILLATLLPLILFITVKFIAPMLGERYALYTSVGELSLGWTDFDKVPAILYGVWAYSVAKKKDPNFMLYLFLYSIALIVSIYTSIFSFGRLQWYFNIFGCFMIPMAMRNIRDDVKARLLYVPSAILILLCSIAYANLLTSKKSNIVNMEQYKNVLLERR